MTEPLSYKQRRIYWLAALLFVVAAVFVINRLFFSSTKSEADSYPADTGSSQSGPNFPPSILDDWLAAVCKPGTYTDGIPGVLRNSDGNATCRAQAGSGLPILIGQYSSEFKANNDMALYKGADYAMAVTQSGMIQVFVAPGHRNNGSNELQSLSQYGFEVGKVPYN